MANVEYILEHDVVPALKSIAASLEKLANPLYIVTSDGKLTTFDPTPPPRVSPQGFGAGRFGLKRRRPRT